MNLASSFRALRDRVHLMRGTDFRDLPSPKGRPIWGHAALLREDPLGLFLNAARQYGDVVALQYGIWRAVALFHPDDIEQVLVTQNRKFVKHVFLRMTSPFLGNGLLLSEGDFWRRQRRLAQPAFHKARINAYGEVMVAYTERMLEGWQPDVTIDVHAEMMTLTRDIVVKTLFGTELGPESAQLSSAFDELLDVFRARLEFPVPLPSWLPVESNRRTQRALQTLDHVVYSIIRERRRSNQDRGDLLSMLLAAQDDENSGAQMTDRQLRDEVTTIFLAGHETTAVALAFTIYLLGRHVDVDAKLHDELRAVLGSKVPNVDDLVNLPYLRAVVTEGMRLYPPAYIFGREAIESFKLRGRTYPAGTMVQVSPWVTHRDPRYYAEPEVFRPERWLGDLATQIPKYAYFPFGGGPRLCIGDTFAKMEAQLVLATIMQRYRLALSKTEVGIEPSITIRPKGLCATAIPRDPD